MEDRASQHEKAQYPMLMTLLGIWKEVRELHPEKALSPILVILSERLIELSATHSSKAELPIVVTLSGIRIEVRDMQPLKA